MYATELFLSTPDVFEESYPSLDIECRLRLLEICHDILLSLPENTTKVEDKKRKDLPKAEPSRKYVANNADLLKMYLLIFLFPYFIFNQDTYAMLEIHG